MQYAYVTAFAALLGLALPPLGHSLSLRSAPPNGTEQGELKLGKWEPPARNESGSIAELDGHSVVSSKYLGCNSTSCSIDSALVEAEFGNQLILVLGCSIDVNAIGYFCGSITGIPLDAFVGQAIMSYLVHCNVGHFTLVYSYHPGASAPPYAQEYNSAFGTTQQIVTKAKQDVIAKFGKAPTYVVVDASLWDVANWWQKLGRPAYPYPIPTQIIQHWCTKEVPDLLAHVSNTFGVPVAYRTPPTIFANPNSMGLSAYTVEEMVHCVEMHKDGWNRIYGGKYGLIDFHHFVDRTLQNSGHGASRFYKDSLHPGPELSLMYINSIMLWVRANIQR